MSNNPSREELLVRFLTAVKMLDNVQRELVKIRYELDAATKDVVKAIGVILDMEPIEYGQ